MSKRSINNETAKKVKDWKNIGEYSKRDRQEMSRR